MPAMEPLCHLMGIDTKDFSKDEKQLIEANMFLRVYEELIEVFRNYYKSFFQIINLTIDQEDAMLERNFIKIILHDILLSEEYTLHGIAHYTDTPEEVICELASGLNTKPLATCLRKVIEIHRSVRRELYQEIGRRIAAKITAQYLAVA